jgi:GNAT superfamily N-acetyltransferase
VAADIPGPVGWAIERVTGEPALREWQAVLDASLTHDVDDLPADPVEEFRPLLGGDQAGERHLFLLGRSGGTVVAGGCLRVPLDDNPDLADLELYVRPGHRRRGHGRALLEGLLHEARAAGRTRILAHTTEPLVPGAGPPAPGRAFAQAVGARPALREIRRRLHLADLPAERRHQLAQDAWKHAADYDTLEWADRSPEELLGDMVVLMERMSTDPPLGATGWEPERWDAARVRGREAAILARGRQRLVTAARHRSSGRMVGVSELGVNHARAGVVYQWDTVVVPEHRGHQLGLLLKTLNLDHLARLSPGSRTVTTWNAADNSPMVAINERLGFRPMEAWTRWRLDLT